MNGFQWLLETYMKRENQKTTIIQQERESYLSDESVTEKAMSSKQGHKFSNVAFDPKAHSDRWNNFILEIMSGDIDKAKFLQKIFEYVLTGDTRHECMTILYGASTRNGKGTLCESVLYDKVKKLILNHVKDKEI